MIVLITGPVRSGKSVRAARVARDLGRPVTYVATARIDPTDPEMADRVARHRAERGAQPLIELWQGDVPDLPGVVAAAAPGTTLLVDSLGTWIAGHLLDIEALAETDAVGALAVLAAKLAPLDEQLFTPCANLVFVGEETGWGLVPPSPIGRIFRDELGRLMQRIAARAARVELVVAGYALDLKLHGVAVGP